MSAPWLGLDPVFNRDTGECLPDREYSARTETA